MNTGLGTQITECVNPAPFGAATIDPGPGTMLRVKGRRSRRIQTPSIHLLHEEGTRAADACAVDRDRSCASWAPARPVSRKADGEHSGWLKHGWAS